MCTYAAWRISSRRNRDIQTGPGKSRRGEERSRAEEKMMTTAKTCRRMGRLFCCVLMAGLLAGMGHAQAPETTLVNDVVYRADGTPAKGTVLISWPAFQ